MKDLIIEVSPAKNKKGRSFRATLLAYVTADKLWPGGSTDTDTIRPIWMMFAGTSNELRPFVANLQMGRRAELKNNSYSRRAGDRFEALKSAGYQFAWQHTTLGSLATAFLPDLFRLDPGMVDPEGVSFCILPAKDWLKPGKAMFEHLIRLGADPSQPELSLVVELAPLFIAYLDRRTRCPLIPDRRFYAQVLYSSLAKGLASLNTADRYSYGNYPWGQHRRLGYSEFDTESVGLSKGLAFQSSHENLEVFLAEQVKIYEEITHGSN